MEDENQNLYQLEETRSEESYEVPVGENDYSTSSSDYYDMSAQALSPFDKLEQSAQNITIWGVGAYAVYYFYKKVVSPYLYPESKPKTVIERIQEIKESISTSIDAVKRDVTKLEIKARKIERDVLNIGNTIHYINVDLATHCNTMERLEKVKEGPESKIPSWQML